MWVLFKGGSFSRIHGSRFSHFKNRRKSVKWLNLRSVVEILRGFLSWLGYYGTTIFLKCQICWNHYINILFCYQIGSFSSSIALEYPVRYYERVRRLQRNFYSLGYYCSYNLHSRQNDWADLTGYSRAVSSRFSNIKKYILSCGKCFFFL